MRSTRRFRTNIVRTSRRAKRRHHRRLRPSRRGSAARATTVAANPHLKTMFGYTPGAPDAQVQPFDPDRFVDPKARQTFIDRLSADGAVTDYLLRLRRLDNSQL